MGGHLRISSFYREQTRSFEGYFLEKKLYIRSRNANTPNFQRILSNLMKSKVKKFGAPAFAFSAI